MPRPSLFLSTKLMPPRAVSELLSRPRLIRALEGNLQSPITLVAADAGCGKTTLISEFIRNETRPTVWYQLDHTDAEPSAFLGYVTRGIKNIVPDFGEAILDYLADANEELLRTPERAADLLINEILESVEQPLIIVLDDYHHIGRETVVHRIVDRLLQYSSDLVHLIITTRDLPPLAMMRRRAQDSVLILTREDLLFTDAEVKDLFSKTLGVDLATEELEAYRDRTHGWVTALQLVKQVAEQERHLAGEKPVNLVEMLQRSEKDIFDYFAEEVFARESESVQQLLLSVSLLDSLPLETCSLLFPDHRCSATLPELSQKNVFLTVSGDGRSGEEYRLHPLFRDFLLRRLRSSIGRAGISKERKRIAGTFLAQNNWQSALPFLLDAEDFEEAAKLLAGHGRDLIAAGAFVTLDTYSSRIPVEFLRSHPESLLHAAEVARIQGNIEHATGLMNDAVSIFHDIENKTGEAEALQSLASIARRRGDISSAMQYLNRAETLAQVGSETLLKCANTRGLCLISEGKWAEAEQQFRFALELAEQQGNRHYQRLVMHNLALPPGFRGDFGEALRWFRRMFRDDEGAKLPQEAIGHLNVARLHLYRGEFDDTARHLARSLEICQLFNMRLLRPEIFEAYANYYRDIDDMVHAEEFYERAAKAYDEVEVDPTTKELNEERARFLIRRGNLRRARVLLESLIEARAARSNITGAMTARLHLAQIDLIERKLDGLSERVQELHKYFQEANHYYDEALSALLLAEVMLTEGREGEAAGLVNRVLDLSARYDYDYWLKKEIGNNPALFAIEEIAERLPADLRVELSRSPKDDVDSRDESSGGVAVFIDLSINVLGPVDIFRDPAQPFASDAWTTRRARDIFCFIATSKHRRVPKDVLIDCFWPDEDPKVVEKNFHPTISHIRKALNSRQTFKQNFITFRDGSYQLNPELSYLIDAEEFDRLVADAEAAKREKDTDRLRKSLEGAYKLYRGEFMPGIYEAWADERRNYYSEQFGRVTGALAKLSLAERRFAEALRYAGESLKLDPYREEMHRLTIKVHTTQGKPAAAKKHYDSMIKLLYDELGIAPSNETRRLAAELGIE